MGLDSFKSDSGSGDSDKNSGSNPTNETTNNDTKTKITDLPDKIYRKWNNMSEKERVKPVREHGIQDFKPSVQLDCRWSWEQVIEIECVCGKTIRFNNTGSCSRCNRSYGKRGRTVIKLNEPEDKKIHNNDSN